LIIRGRVVFGLKNKIKAFLKNNILFCLMLLFCLAMYVYGMELKAYGYCVTSREESVMPIALAFVETGRGVFPWNLEWQEYETEKTSPAETQDIDFIDRVISFADASEGVEETDSPGTDFSPEDENLMAGIEEDGYLPSEDKGVVSFVTVEETYFDDAVFIGDSRMVGVYEYAGIESATYYAKVSMTIFDLMESRVTTNDSVRTVREGLEENQFGKVYLMVGLNELGTGDVDYFIAAYQGVIEEIRALQPEAIIYIQGIMHVAGDMDRSDSIFNNENINERNEALRQLANGEDVFYIDVNEVYDDENGNLRSDCTSDDVHLYGNCYEEWYQFFMHHGVPTDAEGSKEDDE